MSNNYDFLDVCVDIEEGEFTIDQATKSQLDDVMLAISFCEKDGMLLKHFSERVRSMSLVVEAAVQNNHHAIQFAEPSVLRNVDYCIKLYQLARTPYFAHGASLFGYMSPVVLNNVKFLVHLKPEEILWVYHNKMDRTLMQELSRRTSQQDILLDEAVKALYKDMTSVI